MYFLFLFSVGCVWHVWEGMYVWQACNNSPTVRLHVDAPLVGVQAVRGERALLAEGLDLVDDLITAIVALAGEALGVLVGQGRAESVHHRWANRGREGKMTRWRKSSPHATITVNVGIWTGVGRQRPRKEVGCHLGVIPPNGFRTAGREVLRRNALEGLPLARLLLLDEVGEGGVHLGERGELLVTT